MIKRCMECGRFNADEHCGGLCALCYMERIHGVQRLGDCLIWRDVKKLLGVTPHSFAGKKKESGHYCVVPREEVYRYWLFHGVTRRFDSEDAAWQWAGGHGLNDGDGLVIRGDKRGRWWLTTRRPI